MRSPAQQRFDNLLVAVLIGAGIYMIVRPKPPLSCRQDQALSCICVPKDHKP